MVNELGSGLVSDPVSGFIIPIDMAASTAACSIMLCMTPNKWSFRYL